MIKLQKYIFTSNILELIIYILLFIIIRYGYIQYKEFDAGKKYTALKNRPLKKVDTYRIT